ncbi:hypothetical protein H311_01412 [Anncaliia algerae PRA109]|nr:hypothetical protein H311_01412 [Anncaliia algerae PRA109]
MRNTSETEILTRDKIKEIHEKYTHPGITCLYKTLKAYYNTKGLLKVIKGIVKSCKECQLSKSNKHKYGYSKGIISTNKPLENISSCVFKPFDASQ